MSLNLSKTQGVGNSGKITVSREIYYGREDQKHEIMVSSGGASSTIIVTTIGHSKFITSDLSHYSIGNSGGELTISGKGNIGPILQFAEAIGREGDVVLTKVLINNIEQDLPEDSSMTDVLIGEGYGKRDQYSWEVVLTISENKTIVSRTWTITVGAREVQTDDITITQASGEEYIYVNIDGTSEETNLSLELSESKLSTDFYILSNAEWNIDVNEMVTDTPEVEG